MLLTPCASLAGTPGRLPPCCFTKQAAGTGASSGTNFSTAIPKMCPQALSSGLGKRWDAPVPRSISSPRDGRPVPCHQAALDYFLERLLAALPVAGDFSPGCHCSAAVLYLAAQEQGAGSLGWLPLARVPWLVAMASDLGHLPSNGCRAGPGRAAMGTRWSHRLLHRDPIPLAGSREDATRIQLSVSTSLSFPRLLLLMRGPRAASLSPLCAHQKGRPPRWERPPQLAATLEPGEHIASD